MKLIASLGRAHTCVPLSWLAMLWFCLLGALPVIAQTGDCTPSPEGLVGWWRGEGNGLDSAGTNHSTLLNATTSPGLVGAAFDLNGTSAYVELPNTPALKPAGSFTIEGWIFPRRLTDAALLAKWGDGASDNGNQRCYIFAIGQNGSCSFAITDAAHQLDGTFQTFSSAAGIVRTSQWQHVAAVYDQATGIRQLFVDGSLRAARTNPPITVLAGTAKVALGALLPTAGTASYRFNGLMDEFSFYHRALATNEVAALYRSGSAGKCVSVSITGEPASQTVWEGQWAHFSVSTAGSSPQGYQWTRQGTNLPGATSAALVFPAQLADAGLYQVVVTNPLNTVTSQVATLTVIGRTNTATGMDRIGANSASTEYNPGGAIMHYHDAGAENWSTCATVWRQPFEGTLGEVAFVLFARVVNPTNGIYLDPVTNLSGFNLSVHLWTNGASGFLTSTNAAHGDVVIPLGPGPAAPTLFGVTGVTNTVINSTNLYISLLPTIRFATNLALRNIRLDAGREYALALVCEGSRTNIVIRQSLVNTAEGGSDDVFARYTGSGGLVRGYMAEGFTKPSLATAIQVEGASGVKLTIARREAFIELSWPELGGAAGLPEIWRTTNVADGPWSLLPGTLTTNFLLITNTASQEFFRLKLP